MSTRPLLRSFRARSSRHLSESTEAEQPDLECPQQSSVMSLRTVPVRPITLPMPSLYDSAVKACDAPVSKKPRHRMTDLQLERLEALYEQTTHPTREEKQSLGNDVGMTLKTVTIWFQNRRQSMRKKSDRRTSSSSAKSLHTRGSPYPRVSMFSAAPSAPAKHAVSGPTFYKALETRPPLAAVPYEGNKSYDRNHKQVSRYRLQRPMEDNIVVKAEELWTLLPSSPTADPGLSIRDYNSSPTLDWLHSSNIALSPSRPTLGEYGSVYSYGEKRTQVLEWACARLEKRRRTCDARANSDDSSQSDTTEDLHSGSESPGQCSVKCPGEHDTENMPISTPHMLIPPEYRAVFSPDILLGASLLLTFKHSVVHE